MGLTAREYEVLKLCALGMGKKEIAGVLNIATKTVSSHCTNMMRKTGAHSTLALILCGINAGLLKASELPQFKLPVFVQFPEEG